MAEYINRDDAKNAVYFDRLAFNRICSVPAADVVERDEGIRIGAELAAMHGSDATSEELSKAYFDGCEQGYKKAMSERKHGKWILVQEYDITEEDGEKYWECSLCGCGSDSYDTTYHTNYCPNCGADMRKGEDNEES